MLQAILLQAFLFRFRFGLCFASWMGFHPKRGESKQNKQYTTAKPFVRAVLDEQAQGCLGAIAHETLGLCQPLQRDAV